MKCVVRKGLDIELKTVDEQIRSERDIILVPMQRFGYPICEVNAVSLTGCFVLVKESLLFHPMLSWVLSVRAYGFSCLYEDGSYFFDQYAGFFKGSIKKKNNGVFHF